MDDQNQPQTKPEECKTYSVPSWRMDYLRDRIEKMARRARKLGCAEPQIVEVGIKDVPQTRRIPDDTELSGYRLEATGRVDRYHLVEVRGEAPKFSGWEFIAAVDQMPEVGNIVRTVPGKALPAKYRTEKPHCDHCKVNRTRINHYVVQHTETGETRMVGSSCICDFLGGVAPENVAQMATLWAGIDSLMGEACEGGGCREPQYLDLALYLSWVSASIRERGWVSAGRARQDETAGVATKVHALNGMFWRPTPQDRVPPFVLTDADRDLAAKSIAWAQTVEPKSDFDHNLRTLAQAEVLPHSGAGIAAAMVFCYKREVEREVLRAKRQSQFAASRYVGEIGKRQDFTVTVVGEHEVAGNYGVTHIYKMLDGQGNCLTWFSSAGGLNVGGEYVLKGTVKNHEEYKGTQQTTITRCKVLRTLKEGPDAEPQGRTEEVN